MADHRLPTAKEVLQQQWKAWIVQYSFKARREAATRAKATTELPVYDA
jgi:hypothetical protein